jgi:L-2-hydroxyglutarate oxidase LhgO
MIWDAVVVGAGVVGLACAERSARAGLTTLVLERHARAGTETSSRNSQVVHAGLYYPTGSLKAELCVRGNASLWAWCEQRSVPHARVGKFIVAPTAAGEPELETLLARGRANGVPSLERVPAARVAAEEPNVIAAAALWSPTSGIVDAHAFMASLQAEARAHGADFAFAHTLLAAEPRGSGWRLTVRDLSGAELAIDAERVINSAGLCADEIAALAGGSYQLRYVKGSYFRLRRPLVRHLVYPVPEPNLVGLGVHVTVELDGAARLGPDVEPLAGRAIDYAVDETRAPAFFSAASRYLRGLREEDLSPDQSGVRPKLAIDRVADFVIAEGRPGWVDLVGIESPGLTCALEIGDRVLRLLRA